jgi:hypothetical protein
MSEKKLAKLAKTKKSDSKECVNFTINSSNLHDNCDVANNQPKVAFQYVCNICDYNTSKKFNYELHLTTKKHKKLARPPPTYNCEICNYHTSNKYNYDKHMYSLKHKYKMDENSIINNNNNDNNNDNDNDNKKIKLFDMSFNNIDLTNIKDIDNMKNSELLVSIMGEIKTMMKEQNQTIMEAVVNNPTIINNNNNNHTNNHQFNMNMFLNETCKDAMNMSEFIENLTVTMEDMEMTGTLGFAKGMSRIIMNNLNALEVHKRPIHCSDAKRETLYVKNNGVWEKDTDDKKHTKELIYKVSSLNLKHLLKWRELPRNKGYDNPEHKKNDEFTILVMEINKVKIEEIEKVVSIISKQVTIDKNKVRMSGYLN